MWRKMSVLFRDHTLGQIRNAFAYACQAWRRFPSARAPYSPVWLDLLITARCNLRCLHCSFRGAQPPSFRDMSMDAYVQILDRFPSALAIVLAGGEPLLHPAVFEMVQVAHARRLKVHIPTNGTLLPRSLDALLDAPVEMLNVSLYGVDRNDFAALTGGQAALFDDAVRAMREIVARRRPGGYPRVLRASFICTKANLSRVADFIRLCEGVGVDQVKLKNLYPVGTQGYGETMCLREDDPDVQRFLGELEALRFSIPVFPPRLYRRQYRRPGCTMPFRFLTIDGDGFIGPCCVESTDPRFGNCFAEADIWNGPTMTAARRNLADSSLPLPPACLHCEEMIPHHRRIGGKRPWPGLRPARNGMTSGGGRCRG